MTFIASTSPSQAADGPTRAQPRPQDSFLTFRSVLAAQHQAWRELPEQERIRHQYLEKHGLSEIDLDNLPAKDRAAHEEKIAALSRQPVFAKPPHAGARAGDALQRAVITLQSVLETPAPDAPHASERTDAVGED